MEKRKRNLDGILIRSICIMVIFMITVILCTCKSIFNQENNFLSYYNTRFYNLNFEGSYKVDNGEWMEFNNDAKFNLNEYHTYFFKGHFNKDIPKNNEIMMRSKDLNIEIKINDKYILGPMIDKEHSSGNIWIGFVSNGITTDDLVEIQITNVYKRINTRAIDTFFDEMYFGSSDGMYKIAFKKNGLDLVMGISILTLGICELLASIIMAILKSKNVLRIVYSGGFTCMAGIWIGIRYNLISLIIPYPILTQSVEVISLELLCLFMTFYLATYVTGKLRVASKVNCIFTILWTTITVLLKLIWNIDMYKLFIVTTLLAISNILIMVIYLGYEYFMKKNKAVRIVIFFVTPMLVGAITDCIRLLANLGDGPIGLNKGIVVAGIIQLAILIYEKRKSDIIIENAIKLENELIQSRIAVMMSQIQPHFLYNSLNTIRYLCTEDPEKAEKAVIDFASFLRGNVDSLSSTDLIPFRKELVHLKHYISLEKNRFGDRVNVEYDISTYDFKIPPLTLQPIVENAVRYGITKKEEGGTVNIKVSETDTYYIITISDDGVGFDKNKLGIKDDKRTHVGIENVRKRLIDQCNGSLSIESTLGKGTTVVLMVSKGEKENENNYS